MDTLYQVRSCSMVPTLADGDVIEIVSALWQDGDIVVARVGSKNVVKRVVGDKLVGDNTEVSAIFKLCDAVILGKVRKKPHCCLANNHLLQAEAALNANVLSGFSTAYWNHPPWKEDYAAASGFTFTYSINGTSTLTGSSVPANAKWVVLSGFNTSFYNTGIAAMVTRSATGFTYTYSVDGTNVQTGSTVPANARWAVTSGVSTAYWNHPPWKEDYAATSEFTFTYSIDGITSLTGSFVPANAKWAYNSGFNTSFYNVGLNHGQIVTRAATNFTYSSYLINQDPNISITSPSTNQSFSTAPGRKTITISGTVSDADNNNVTISAAINGKTKTTVISNTSTAKTWSLTWDVSADNIAEGSYSNILITADDGMGGIATATMGYILMVDRTAPVISISGVANGQTYQNSVTPSFSAMDAGGAGLASVTATLNGASYTSGTAITSAGGQVLVVTATDYAGNQSQQSVNFTVNKAPTCLLFAPATNQTLAEGQGIVVTENRFTVRITPDDANAGDALQYKIIQSGITKVDWQNCSRGSAFDYTFTDVLLGNNVCQVLVRDDKGGQVTRSFTVRNKATGSAAAALSQKGVREVLLALGYPGTSYSCLNDLKPSGYTGPLSFSGIINFLS